MRYRTTISIAGLLLASAALAACGKVENGVCPGDQTDTVPCTVDLCDFDAKSWVHIPDDSLCDKGQRCDPTMGCVAAGGLAGHAYLFGHTDHTGITVTVEGIEGATTMTDKDGNWSFGGLPTGTFNLTYTKDKFITQKQTGVSVFPEAASSPDAVTLTHGVDLSPNMSLGYPIRDQYNATYYSPDHKHAVVRYYSYQMGYTYRGYSLDTVNAKAVDLFFDDTPYYFFSARQFWLTNTHFIWSDFDQTIWSRSYDGSPAVILATLQPKDYAWYVEGTPNDHVLLMRYRDNGTFNEYSLYVTKADGSAALGSPVWVQTDANHPAGFVVNNDTTAILGLDDTTANPPTDGPATNSLKRIDLNTSAVSTVPTGFAANYSRTQSLSPDGKFLLGYLQQSPGSTGWVRGFMIAMDGTSPPSLAPTYGAPAAANYQYSDYQGDPSLIQWFKDGSGVVLQSTAYTNGSTFEGGLKLWLTTAATSTQLIAYNTYFNWQVHNKTVVFRDSGSASAKLLAINAAGTLPAQQTLDVAGAVSITTLQFNDTDPASTYAVWTDNSGSGTQIRSALVPSPLLAAPSVVNMGGLIANTCDFEGLLENTTYWQLCRDTGVLQGFTKSSTTSATQTQGVKPGLTAIPDADRVMFRKYDNKLYTSPGTGTLTDVKLVTNLTDLDTTVRVASKWLIFTDIDNEYQRASNSDGSAIDEPLSKCKTVPGNPIYYEHLGDILTDKMNTTFLLFEVQCAANNLGEYQVPAANLP